MIKWFGRSLVSQIIFILLTLILLWCRTILQPVAMPEPCGFVPIYSLLYAILHSQPILASFLGLTVLLLTGYLFNELLYSNKLIPQGNWMPMYLLIIAASCSPQMLTLHPIHLANLFLLGGLHQSMLHSSKLSLPTNNIAAIMTFIILAALCYFPYIVLLLLLLFLIPSYKAYAWTDITAVILGIIAPIIPVVVIYLMMDRGEEMILLFEQSIQALTPKWNNTAWTGAVVSALFMALMIGAIFYYTQHHGDRPINIRKNIASINYFTLISALTLIFIGLLPLNSALLIYSFSFLTYIFLTHNAKSKFWSITLSLWIVATILYNLFC